MIFSKPTVMIKKKKLEYAWSVTAFTVYRLRMRRISLSKLILVFLDNAIKSQTPGTQLRSRSQRNRT